MGSIGWSELLVIFLVVLLLFGTKRLPEVGRSLGKAIREFKKAGKELQDDLYTNLDLDEDDDTVSRKSEKQVGQG
ncbi:twin-arginine translocase TatA/TatE family subunit [Candidatus Poribacteria bacterium]|nr:twin-arginine translocase TatA/TatE family subunit [Candidatus Poribacteria bacterium]RLA91755.1 MAG: twin-arginine translocase TatA/TatE family subunit [Deltaproteobacteria bacterium]